MLTEKQLAKKRLDVLNDTINHFNSKNRNILNGQCCYSPIGESSEGCAIGRLVKDKVLCKRWDYPRHPKNMDSKGVNSIFDELPNELQELGREFICWLQSLHDAEKNWDEKGLSKFGKDVVKNIKNRYIN